MKFRILSQEEGEALPAEIGGWEAFRAGATSTITPVPVGADAAWWGAYFENVIHGMVRKASLPGFPEHLALGAGPSMSEGFRLDQEDSGG